ncbi:M14 family zinc carboxypeptidase [Aureitalea marina]|uniref:Zinc carboxypeptidase n=1 Tax=Aureitalea marina TaxID=930804 RepID=A0A2S7KQV6_9FLAO|nr:M14 family zinc carboxypeptidase [Aureitalea marina]PQB05014.1 zinc carboxypeptidase [Aureitalea marina]
MKFTNIFLFCFLALAGISTQAQDYYLQDYGPFDPEIPSPEQYLGYQVGAMHTRHDLIVGYMELLARLSDRAAITYYGQTHEARKLVMLTISDPDHIQNMEQIRLEHLKFTNPDQDPGSPDALPILINLGYNVHGNEPSSSEAALLTAYTLVASSHPDIVKYRSDGVIFIDPTINPDGRDRHTQWANQFRADPLVSDNYDAEHWEAWPRGRTNHYWFDLNRDWLLAINPESRGKLAWYHQWYPNVVTDFHEMGTNSNYFFEPMKPIGSEDPIMPKENYEDLNNLFAPYYSSALDNIGSFYFTKEAFDGTYPGYGSSYPDLQGALALLFEQASSRGHLQKTDYGEISFAFTIRNQFTSSMATVKAAVENKVTLREYQQKFFNSAVTANKPSNVAGYEFGDPKDVNRTIAFIDKLLLHRIKVYQKGDRFVVPTRQPQQRMVQSFFETYNKYRDSVFYDASAWSVANFYNMKYKPVRSVDTSKEVSGNSELVQITTAPQSNYAYLLDWDDYYGPAALNYLQKNGVQAASAFKPFTTNTHAGQKEFNYGTIMIPVSKQDMSPQQLHQFIQEAQQLWKVNIYAVSTGFSLEGIDLGSGNFRKVEAPKVLMLIGDGVNSYEAGEVWHLLDTRVKMPMTKLQLRTFNFAPLDQYNTLVMVSGSYSQLDSLKQKKIKDWVSKGNTLITIAGASKWAINKKLVKEKLTVKTKDSVKNENSERLSYVDAPENNGREEVGGAIFEVDLDLTHPLAFGYTDRSLPVYKNNEVFIQPSQNPYATVAKYTADPHIDGYISENRYENYLKPSASLVVSAVGAGRVVLFADNPNFRGSWFGTNRLFLNALFLGNQIRVPRVND